MKFLAIALQQAKLLLKSPYVLLLFSAGTLFLIFIFGQSFGALFESTGAGMRALDYFGTTILTLAVFQGSGIASWGIFKEKRSNTDLRLRVAPVGRLTVLFGTFSGSWASIFALSALVLFLSRALLGVDYGPSLLLVLSLVAAESLLAAALGVSLSVLLRQERAATGLMNAIVPVLVFLGGGYMIIPESGFLHEAARFSPIRWVNLAMIQAARPGANPYLLPAFAFCFAASILLLAPAALAARRES